MWVPCFLFWAALRRPKSRQAFSHRVSHWEMNQTVVPHTLSFGDKPWLVSFGFLYRSRRLGQNLKKGELHASTLTERHRFGSASDWQTNLSTHEIVCVFGRFPLPAVSSSSSIFVWGGEQWTPGPVFFVGAPILRHLHHGKLFGQPYGGAVKQLVLGSGMLCLPCCPAWLSSQKERPCESWVFECFSIVGPPKNGCELPFEPLERLMPYSETTLSWLWKLWFGASAIPREHPIDRVLLGSHFRVESAAFPQTRGHVSIVGVLAVLLGGCDDRLRGARCRGRDRRKRSQDVPGVAWSLSTAWLAVGVGVMSQQEVSVTLQRLLRPYWLSQPAKPSPVPASVQPTTRGFPNWASMQHFAGLA